MLVCHAPCRQWGEVASGIPSLGRVGILCRFLGLLAFTAMIAAPPAAADPFFNRFSELRIVDGYELVSYGEEGNWHPDGWYVDGTRLTDDEISIWLETGFTGGPTRTWSCSSVGT